MKNFNEAINDFVAWHLRKSSGDVSEEEFNSLLEKRKEDTIKSIESFKERIEFLPNTDNQCIPLIFLLMMFSSFGDLNKIMESFIGKKLSSEELNEYVNLSTNKINVDKVIELLKHKEIDESIVSPVVKSLFGLKDIVLPYFEGLSEGLRVKLSKYEDNKRISLRIS